jgi:hypothetical protein
MYKCQKAKKVKKPNPYKEAREQRTQAMIDKYDKIRKTLESFGASVNDPAEYVDKLLEDAAKSNRKSA